MSRQMEFKPVRPSVQSFAQDMERVLRKNDHKSGWEDMDYLEMLQRLDDERVELELAVALRIQGGDPLKVLDEAVDMANFCMFIAAKAHKECTALDEEVSA